MDINWDEPLEAVHEDGAVVPLKELKDCDFNYWNKTANTNYRGHPDFYICTENAEICRGVRFDGWTIRNRQPQKTLEQRMEDLVRRMAKYGSGFPANQPLYFQASDFDEARSIVTELDRAKQDDADLAMARLCVTGKVPDSDPAIQSALAAIRLMREKGND